MLYYAFVFFIIALICGLFGFGVIASAFGAIAKILFWVFVAIFLFSVLMSGLNGKSR